MLTVELKDRFRKGHSFSLWELHDPIFHFGRHYTKHSHWLMNPSRVSRSPAGRQARDRPARRGGKISINGTRKDKTRLWGSLSLDRTERNKGGGRRPQLHLLDSGWSKWITGSRLISIVFSEPLCVLLISVLVCPCFSLSLSRSAEPIPIEIYWNLNQLAFWFVREASTSPSGAVARSNETYYVCASTLWGRVFGSSRPLLKHLRNESDNRRSSLV